MYDNFEFYIQHSPVEGSVEIYLTQQDKNKNQRIFLTYEDGDFISHTHEMGELGVKPLLKLPWGLSKIFLQEMANTLYKNGIKPEGKPVLENELTATKYHLEDMRKLVFEGKK